MNSDLAVIRTIFSIPNMLAKVKFVLLMNIFATQSPRCECLVEVDCELNDIPKVNVGQEDAGQRGSVIMTNTMASHTQCWAMCRSYEGCSHYSWELGIKRCDLVHIPGDPTLSCQGKMGPCGDRPCGAGKMCVHTKAATSYLCFPADRINPTWTTTTTTPTTTASPSTTTTPTPTTNTTPTTTTPATTTAPSTTTPTSTTTTTTTTETPSSTLTPTSTTDTTTTTPTTTPTSTTTTTTTTTTPTTIGRMTLGMSCSISADCVLTNAECNNGGCRCVLGYQFSNTKQTCSQSCVQLGSDFVLYPDVGIMGYNDEIYDVNSVEECSQRCISSTSIVCKTFEFILSDSDASKCRLATVFWYDVSSDRRLSISGVDLYSRQCQ